MISAKENNVSDTLGDFKKFTRKEWMIEIFKKAGEANSRNTHHQFWQQDNQPKIIYTPNFAAQKLEYMHNNPVEAGIVEKAEEYTYSSARDYYWESNSGNSGQQLLSMLEF